MNLVDEEDVAAFQRREQPGQVTRFFDNGAAGVFDRGAHGLRDDVRERRLAQAGRAGKQHVFEHVAASTGGGDEQFEPFAHLVLPLELAERGRAQGNVKGRVRLVVSIERFVHRQGGALGRNIPRGPHARKRESPPVRGPQHRVQSQSSPRLSLQTGLQTAFPELPPGIRFVFWRTPPWPSLLVS